MKMKVLKAIAFLAAMLIVLGCGFSCMAAVVTDGSKFYNLGDANMDGKIDIRDLVRMRKIADSASVSEYSIVSSDINGDGTVAANDMVTLSLYLLEKTKNLEPDTSVWNTEIR